ncbi:MAG TPA: HAD-IA family hydrolase [Dehalococcoidales bacterium]|nr:HAD-IA family hydrolase [Dehalococcoidales bacterium]
MAYRAVIFDLFGTLIPSFGVNDYDRIISRMASAAGCPLKSFQTEWHGSFKASILGQYPSLSDRLIQIVRKLGLPVIESKIEEAARIFYDYHLSTLLPRPEAVEVLQNIKKRGLKTGLITDCSPETPAEWSKTSLAGYFDAAVFSCLEGIKKPDPRIYQIAIDRLEVLAGDCLYVGDGSSRELSGAEAAGLKAVQLFIPEERHSDVFRVDLEHWEGRTINSLSQVVRLL